jgi:hypothetical protein
MQSIKPKLLRPNCWTTDALRGRTLVLEQSQAEHSSDRRCRPCDDNSIIVGDVASGKVSAARFHDDALAVVESVNEAADHVACRKIFETGRNPDRSEVSSSGFEFAVFLKRMQVMTPADTRIRLQ